MYLLHKQIAQGDPQLRLANAVLRIVWSIFRSALPDIDLKFEGCLRVPLRSFCDVDYCCSSSCSCFTLPKAFYFRATLLCHWYSTPAFQLRKGLHHPSVLPQLFFFICFCQESPLFTPNPTESERIPNPRSEMI